MNKTTVIHHIIHHSSDYPFSLCCNAPLIGQDYFPPLVASTNSYQIWNTNSGFPEPKKADVSFGYDYIALMAVLLPVGLLIIWQKWMK